MDKSHYERDVMFAQKMLIALYLTLALTANAAEEKRTPLDSFRGTTQYHLMACRIIAKTAFLKVEAGDSSEAYSAIGTCIKEGKDEAKGLFQKANAKVAKNPASS